MSFDGIQKNVNPYTNPLGTHLAAYEAAQQARGRPKVKSVKQGLSTDPVHKELAQYNLDPDEEQDNSLSEEEREQILIFARFRGLMNFALESGETYLFRLNEENGLIELVAASTDKVMLQLTAEELMQVSDKVQRYAGMLTDRKG